MKNWKQFTFVAIIVIVGIIIGFMACNNDNETTHEHKWGDWKVTTAPTCTTEGEETRVCTLDATHKETRPIEALGHDWGNWEQITAPTYTTEGVETRTCTHDATHTETRAISRIPFTSIANFGTWLTSQPVNTAENPYTIALNVGDDEISDYTNLSTIFYNASNKYVFLDFSGSTITSIVDDLFSSCNNLTGITIPNSVTSIGEQAFNSCTNLTSITIPNSVISIGTRAFRESDLVSIVIPDSVTSIGEQVFWGCRSLSDVIIGKGITSIPRLTFYNCDSLSSVTIPNNVIKIERQAFLNCPKLTSVTFEGTIPSSGFSDSDTPSFFGDLRAKFYATDTTNGTPGTYTTIAPVSSSSVWTKQ